MKTLIITAALSVLSLGNIAEAQDSKVVSAKAKIVEQMLASLPTQDPDVTNTAPTIPFTTRDLRVLAMLPTQDSNIESPVFFEQAPTTLVNDKKEQTIKPIVETTRKEVRRTEI